VSPTAPRHLVVVLLDSLNRHMLGPYGGDEFETPTIDAFARSALRFDRHHAGSLPCMPARHDLLVGALDFPWRPWGSIEVWEDAVTRSLRRRGVTTVLVAEALATNGGMIDMLLHSGFPLTSLRHDGTVQVRLLVGSGPPGATHDTVLGV